SLRFAAQAVDSVIERLVWSIGQNARGRNADPLARLLKRLAHGRIDPRENRVQVTFLDRRQARDHVLAQNSRGVSDRLLTWESMFVGDDPTNLSHASNRVRSGLVAPVAMTEDVQRFEGAGVWYPDAQGAVVALRVPSDGSEEGREGLEVRHIAADRIKADQ